jgi:Carboxypeptidase regulatory-like domain/TonB dependent receptor
MWKTPNFRLALFSFFVFLIVSLNSPANGQTETGTIYGSVTDPTDAVVSRATVRLIDIDRGLRTEVATGSTGFYSFASVRPGHYRMEVEKNGFKLVRVTEIIVNVQGNLEQNFKLEVGSASETITVEANAANVNTSNGTVSTLVDHTFAENLPLNGRTFQTLIMLTPGVVVSETAYDDQGQFSINGQRADANYFTVDGVSANFGVTGYFPLLQAAGGALPALSASGGTNSLVSVDAMREFRVQTSSFAPEFGRTPGGQISILTRSGTNDFHGVLFEYFRNSVLDANDWFADLNHLPKPAERQNDFGGVLGGPLVRDRTFFFFSYEGLRLRLPSTQETVVPNAASRGRAQNDGLSILPYLNAYPVANGTELGSGLAQFNSTFSNPSSLNAYSVRLDQTLTAKINLFGRYSYSPSSLDQRGAFPAPFTVLSMRELESTSTHTLTLGTNQLISSRINNEIRANYSNHRITTKYEMDSFGGAVPVPGSSLFPTGHSAKDSLLELFIVGAGEFAVGKQAIDEQRQINLIDNVSYVKGSHQVKFGVDYRWLSPFSSPDVYSQFAEFTGVTTCSTQPCTETAGDALSDTAYAAFVHALQSNTLLSHNFSLYGQDTWMLSPRLTLTYGLRWDINPPLKGKNSENQPFTVIGLNDPATMTLARRGTPLYDTTYGNVAPRIGMAYQLRGQSTWSSVIRGGFGIFYDLGSGSLGGVSSYFPYHAVNSLSLAPFPLTSSDAVAPALTTSPPVSNIIVAVPHLKLPRTYEWNVAFDQELGKKQNLSFTYVGAAGRDLLRMYNLLSPNSNFAFVAVTDNSATSDYQALQAKFERRLSNGLQALASYTWSHSIDIASTDAVRYQNSPSFVANPNIDRGNSDFDIRHSFTAGVTYRLRTPGWNNVARSVLGRWSIDAFILARTAPPVNIIGGYSFTAGTVLQFRPNFVSGVPLELFDSHYPGGKIFNMAAFTPPAQGQQGNFARNVLRGFGAAQADIAFQREFYLTEATELRFRGEFFNIFNHPNFGPPIGDLTSSQFGYSTQMLASSLGSGGPNGGLNPLYQIGGPRSIQLALKLQF